LESEANVEAMLVAVEKVALVLDEPPQFSVAVETADELVQASLSMVCFDALIVLVVVVEG
jgi:hypothetical protein